MNKLFSGNLKRLKHESKLSLKDIRTELCDREIHVEQKKLKSWFDGEIPENRLLKALARIFSEALKREITVSELLGNSAKQETRFEFKLFKQDSSAVEIYKDNEYIRSIYLKKDEIVLISQFLGQFRREVESRIKIDCGIKPPSIKIKILGGGER